MDDAGPLTSAGLSVPNESIRDVCTKRRRSEHRRHIGRQHRCMHEALLQKTYDDGFARLPSVDPSQRERVLRELERLAHARSADGAESPMHLEAFARIVPLLEALLPTDPDGIRAQDFAQLAYLAQFPGVAQPIALQLAFGPAAGEANRRKIMRVFDAARARGVAMDDYVTKMRADGAIPHDALVRLFLGEERRRPSTNRVRLGIALLRRTASMVPAEYRPPLLCAVAWLHWSRGQRAVAQIYLAEASRIEPSDILAYSLMEHFGSRMPSWLG